MFYLDHTLHFMTLDYIVLAVVVHVYVHVMKYIKYNYFRIFKISHFIRGDFRAFALSHFIITRKQQQKQQTLVLRECLIAQYL